MKLFSILTSFWYDPHWWDSRTKAWKQRRWYIARVPLSSPKGKTFALQVGPLTIKFLVEYIDG